MSQKNILHRQARRRKLLKAERKRRTREQALIHERGGTAKRSRRHRQGVALFIVGLFLAGIFIVASKFMRRSGYTDNIRGMYFERQKEFGRRYPYGYKILAFSDGRPFETDVTVLLKDIKIDWGKIAVRRLPADPMAGEDERLKLEIPSLSSADSQDAQFNITSILARAQRRPIILTRINNRNFVVEIIHDEGSILYLLFGLQ